jgi:hypothetical protein
LDKASALQMPTSVVGLALCRVPAQKHITRSKGGGLSVKMRPGQAYQQAANEQVTEPGLMIVVWSFFIHVIVIVARVIMEA